jgi:hypothetical protein
MRDLKDLKKYMKRSVKTNVEFAFVFPTWADFEKYVFTEYYSFLDDEGLSEEELEVEKIDRRFGQAFFSNVFEEYKEMGIDMIIVGEDVARTADDFVKMAMDALFSISIW